MTFRSAFVLSTYFLFIACGSDGGSNNGPTDDMGNPIFGENDVWYIDTGPPIACSSISDCPAEKPFCDPNTGTCAQCLENMDCGGSNTCVEGICVTAGGCPANAKVCKQDELWICYGDGSGWVIEQCEGPCVNGDCLPCAPGQLGCLGTQVVLCSQDGTTYDTVQECPGLCVQGACATCQPGQHRCVDANVLEVCAENGGGFIFEQDCAAEEGGVCFAGKCVSACQSELKGLTNAGCDYWAVDLDNFANTGMGVDHHFAVIVSNHSSENSEVTITQKSAMNAQETQVASATVAPGGLEVFELPNSAPTGSNITWTGYKIKATSAIVAYQFNPLDDVDVYSNDATMLTPSNTFGKEYIAFSRKQETGYDAPQSAFVTCEDICANIPGGQCVYNAEYQQTLCEYPIRGTITVLAYKENTQVTVTPSTPTLAGMGGVPSIQAGQSQSFTLQPFQVLNLKSDQKDGDLTGTIITSDKGVLVIGGHEAAGTSDRCCWDHLEHTMFPVQTWGTTYVAGKSQKRGIEKDYYRVMAASNGTNVNFTPAVTNNIVLNRGQWVEFSTDLDFIVQSDKPISVAQFLASSMEIMEVVPGTVCTSDWECSPNYTCTFVDFDANFNPISVCLGPSCNQAGTQAGCPNGHTCSCPQELFGQCQCEAIGDPAMIVLAPIQQYREEYIFLTPNKYQDDHITIVAPNSASASLDGMQIPASDFQNIPGTSYKVSRLKVSDGAHHLVGTEPISVIVYGYHDDVSYGYLGGLNLNDL